MRQGVAHGKGAGRQPKRAAHRSEVIHEADRGEEPDGPSTDIKTSARHWHAQGTNVGESLRRAVEFWEGAFDAIVDKSGDGMIVVDRRGMIYFANAAAEAMLDRSTGELLGEHFAVPVIPGKMTEIDLLRDGTPTRIAEMRVVETTWQGNPAYLATLRDVTERKQAEEGARESVRRRDEFLSILSHELRNPLGAISNAATVLAGSGIDHDTFERARRIIERQCGQMSRLLDDLLDVSRVARRKIELRKECLDLSQVIVEAADAARAQVEAARQSLVVRLARVPIAVDADPVRLQQVFVNLLSNASKYSKPGGRIELTSEIEGNEAIVRVRDFGIGLSPETLRAVFEPFVQLDSSLDRSEGGLGLGLAIVYGLVRLHGGSVLASSAGSGKGSEFSVRLPLSASQPARPAANGGQKSAGPLRILLVEDNADVRSMLQTLLEFAGHHVEIAADGLRGTELIELQHPDVALVDIGLPALDGYELARRTRSKPDCRDVFLIALTGYSQPADRKKAISSGFDAHLAKPVRFERLRDLLVAIWQAKEAGRRL